MGESVWVEVARLVDGVELVDFLQAQGLAARLAETGDHWEIEVCYARDERDRLRTDVWGALTTWLAEREPQLVPIAVDEDAYALAPSGD